MIIDKNIHLLAYDSIKDKKGLSISMIDDIILKLKDHSFKFRSHDLLVQKVMAIILKSIFNPKGMSIHSTLKQLSQAHNINCFIVGNISGNIDRSRLAQIITEYIDDQQFLDLY